MTGKLSQNRHVLFAAIFLLAAVLRGYGLADQPPLDDEVAAASSAHNYLGTGMLGRVMWYHPPLRNFVIFLSGALFGEYSAWGLRFGSVLFGSLTVPLLGYLAYALFRSTLAGALASFFLCIDPLHISLSREAFQETTTTFFIVAGVLAAYQAVRKDSFAACYLSGALFGLASASKWHGLFPWAASAAAYAAAPLLVPDFTGERRPAARLLAALAAYLAVPLAVYVSVHIPWLFRGYSMGEFFLFQLWLAKHQYVYVSSEYTEEVLSHRAYLWFVMPVAWVDFVFHQGKAYLNIAFGNFLTWALTLPSLYFLVRAWLKRKKFETGYLATLFLISYLPLVFTTRSIWVFAAPAVIPFAFLMSSHAGVELLEAGKITKKQLAAFLVAAAVLSGVLYPPATFKALEYAWYKPLADRYSPHAGGGN